MGFSAGLSIGVDEGGDLFVQFSCGPKIVLKCLYSKFVIKLLNTRTVLVITLNTDSKTWWQSKAFTFPFVSELGRYLAEKVTVSAAR